MVSNLIGRVGQHENNLFSTHCNTAQADCKTVAGKNWENNTDSLPAQFCADVGCNIFNGCIVVLSAGNNSLGDSNNIMILQGKALGFCSKEN